MQKFLHNYILQKNNNNNKKKMSMITSLADAERVFGPLKIKLEMNHDTQLLKAIAFFIGNPAIICRFFVA